MTKTAAKPSSPPRTEPPVSQGKPARMVRKQLLITSEQKRRMKALATATGRTEAELFREAVDAKLEAAAAAGAGNEDWKAALLAVAGIWADYPEVEDIIAENRKGWARRHARLFGNKE